MKFSALVSIAAIASGAVAHSWLECVNMEVPNKEAAKANPSTVPDEKCIGYPRNKVLVDSYQWKHDSDDYAYQFDGVHACHPSQRQPGQTGTGAPMATATPGQKLNMRFWGNGHSRWDIGSPNHKDPGMVRIYWAGKKETEIEKFSDLNEGHWIPGAQQNFSADAVIELGNGGKSMNERANYFEFTVPEKIENGRHMMVWGWAWNPTVIPAPANADDYNKHYELAWGSCFDITIKDSTFKGACPDIKATKPNYKETDDSTAICSKSCRRGGMADQVCEAGSGDCPSCYYYKENSVSCYAPLANGKCPFAMGVKCSGDSKSTPKREALAAAHGRKHRRNM